MTTDEKLDRALEVLNEVRGWQQTHDVKHGQIAEMLRCHHEELYGVPGSMLPGLKSHVQTMSERFPKCSRFIEALYKVGEIVVAGLILAFIYWLLFVYAKVR